MPLSYDSYTILEDLDLLFQILKSGNRSYLVLDEERCEPSLDDKLYYQLCLIPAFVIVLSFSLTQKRRNILVSCFNGKPGSVYPMDILTRSNRLSYACGFGATVYLVYKVVFESFYAFDYGGPPYLHTLAAVASMLVYGVVFFPVFACLTIGSVYGYGLGSLYVWMMTAVEIYRLFDCTYEVETTVVLVLKSMPQILCLLYLSSCIPFRFVQSLRRREFFVGSMESYNREFTLEDVQKSYHGIHVVNLLKKQEKKRAPDEMLQKIKFHIAKIFCDKIYHWHPDFRYSSRMLTTMLVCALVLYQVALETIVLTKFLFDVILLTLMDTREVLKAESETDLVKKLREILDIAIIVFITLKVVFLLSLAIATLLGVIGILASFSSYRRNLTALYRGDYTGMGKKCGLSNAELLAGCMRYAGYQVGYTAWGFVVQSLILLTVLVIIATIVILFIFKISTWAVDLIYTLWPVPVLAVAVNYTQVIFAKVFFLEDFGSSLSLTNRRIFFIFTYFMFFYNIFMGIFSCLLRIIKSFVLGAFLLPRLDHGILPRDFQFSDPGYHAYIGFLRVEHAHTHPVMLTFVRLLLLRVNKEKMRKKVMRSLNDDDVYDEGKFDIQMVDFGSHSEKTQDESTRQAMFRWHLFYTLVQNPQVRILRKGYLQSLMKARGLGLRLPVSDEPISCDVNTIRERTRDFLRPRSHSQHDGDGDISTVNNIPLLEIHTHRDSDGDIHSVNNIALLEIHTPYGGDDDLTTANNIPLVESYTQCDDNNDISSAVNSTGLHTQHDGDFSSVNNTTHSQPRTQRDEGGGDTSSINQNVLLELHTQHISEDDISTVNNTPHFQPQTQYDGNDNINTVNSTTQLLPSSQHDEDGDISAVNNSVLLEPHTQCDDNISTVNNATHPQHDENGTFSLVNNPIHLKPQTQHSRDSDIGNVNSTPHSQPHTQHNGDSDINTVDNTPVDGDFSTVNNTIQPQPDTQHDEDGNSSTVSGAHLQPHPQHADDGDMSTVIDIAQPHTQHNDECDTSFASNTTHPQPPTQYDEHDLSTTDNIVINV